MVDSQLSLYLGLNMLFHFKDSEVSVYGSGNDQDTVYTMRLVKIIKGNKEGDVYKLHLLRNPIRPDFRKKIK